MVALANWGKWIFPPNTIFISKHFSESMDYAEQSYSTYWRSCARHRTSIHKGWHASGKHAYGWLHCTNPRIWKAQLNTSSNMCHHTLPWCSYGPFSLEPIEYLFKYVSVISIVTQLWLLFSLIELRSQLNISSNMCHWTQSWHSYGSSALWCNWPMIG